MGKLRNEQHLYIIVMIMYNTPLMLSLLETPLPPQRACTATILLICTHTPLMDP